MIDMRDDAEIPYEVLGGHGFNLIGGCVPPYSERATPNLIPNSPLLDSHQHPLHVMTSPTTEQPDTSLHGPNLILDVQNFGPIAEAKDIEFRPMTVLVGPSNSGKTYLAMVLHAFMQGTDPETPAYTQRQRGLSPRVIPNSSEVAKSMVAELREIINVSPELLRSHSSNRFISLSVEQFSEPFKVAFQRFFDRILNRYSSVVASNVSELFEVEDFGQLSSHKGLFAGSSPSVKFSAQGENPFTITLGENGNSCDVSDTVLNIPRDLIDGMRFGDIENEVDDTDQYEYFMRTFINEHVMLFFDDIPYSFYFPTGRTGIMNGHRVFTSNIIARASSFGIDEQMSFTYHLLARDFLRLLVGLRERPMRRRRRIGRLLRPRARDYSRGEDVAHTLEQSVLEGRVRVKDNPGVPDFEYEQSGVVTPMFRASSMVTELAPIIMFLRNYVAQRDLLIIDEPEAHLHPAAQQQMAAALAFMVRSGLRILITTHSHYMVEQLSNFVMAADVDDLDERKRLLGIQGTLGEEDIFLKPQEISVYDFAPQSREGGSVVKEVSFENGYYPEDHMRAISRQFNRNNRIESAILGPE